MEAAENNAVVKRADGIVIIDPDKAKGQKHLVDACPYGAIWWNEEENVPQAWIFDAHLLDRGWKEPRCVQACPTGALRSLMVEDVEMKQVVEQEGLEVLKPELGTNPRVYYKNINRFSKCFIGGTIAAEVNGVDECLEKAIVTLNLDGHKLAESWSDPYGDFKFDDIAPGSGTYKIEISHPDHPSTSVEAELGESVYLGVIKL